jgi:hypothetical protein
MVVILMVPLGFSPGSGRGFPPTTERTWRSPAVSQEDLTSPILVAVFQTEKTE